ncbi:hypothetical protein CANCADRAFT_96682 [Tortispora caseinolytica NRRL Y-17796]|uniref:Uncharacterized protein n=1 Tax=Tortispora caseinolytica NRRL Y-17796 TaxID=767744 RepID=A0A1E4TDM1_9ASCO|nr:hypothetical protein CANCADRAFT_96682 [Tortispora caseinolytica NRRL Y-17796]
MAVHRIASDSNRLVVSAAEKLCLVDLQTDERIEVKAESSITHIAVHNSKIVCTTDDSKELLVYDEKLNLLMTRKFAKRPSALCVVLGEDKVVVGDKSGDVFDISLDPNDSRNSLLLTSDSEKDEPAQQPILGHVSMVLSLLVIEHGNIKYILSGDRDEHIRVSRYPDAYNIESYCLGSRDFVSALALTSDGNIVSGGGESLLRVWNIQGSEQYTIDLDQYKDVFKIVSTPLGLLVGIEALSGLYLVEKTSLQKIAFGEVVTDFAFVDGKVYTATTKGVKVVDLRKTSYEPVDMLLPISAECLGPQLSNIHKTAMY